MTHDELVARAEKWLRGTKRCYVVVTEQYSMAREVPDAIGWQMFESHLIECKASRADFRQDLKKLCRQVSSLAMGDNRYYMAQAGLLKPEEIPQEWGLLEVYPKIVRVVKSSYVRDRQYVARNERVLLVKAMWTLARERMEAER